MKISNTLLGKRLNALSNLIIWARNLHDCSFRPKNDEGYRLAG